jgi:hypothetical protein
MCQAWLCVLSEENCRAGSDADCAASAECGEIGYCAHDGGGFCEAKTNAHCEQSDLCDSSQRCRVEGGMCVE